MSQLPVQLDPGFGVRAGSESSYPTLLSAVSSNLDAILSASGAWVRWLSSVAERFGTCLHSAAEGQNGFRSHVL